MAQQIDIPQYTMNEEEEKKKIFFVDTVLFCVRLNRN